MSSFQTAAISASATAALLRGGNELSQHCLDFFGLYLHESAPKEIRASRGHPGEGLADLKNVLFVGDDAVG